jgi:DNA repair photolyase
MKTIKEGKTMTTRKSNGRCKSVFGTREWAAYNENCILGCSHDCKYCYAKENAIRKKWKTPITWKNETRNKRTLPKRYPKREGRIMFPTTHDITPSHLQECMDFMDHLLLPGNEVLVVSKPHLDCIKAICARFADYKDKILFRFTITSTDSNILKFWEPNAPDLQERLSALQYAFEQGFQTSSCCEPMLDNNVGDLISQTSPFATHSIWLGKMNMPFERLQMNGENDPVTIAKAHQLIAMQTDAYIWGLYFKYKDNPKVKWKDSIKKIVGLEVATEPGLDA